MAKSKYESHVLPRFKEIESWVKQGATDEDIFKRLGIGKQTFYDYKKRYVDFADLLKKNYEYCTDQVENALFEKAMKGDVVAQIFWLKNRRPDKWRDKPEVENKKDDSTEKLDSLIASLEKHIDTKVGQMTATNSVKSDLFSVKQLTVLTQVELYFFANSIFNIKTLKN